MKKKFKTIMALTAALAISMSGMCMTSADEDLTPPPEIGDVVGNSVTVDGNPATGTFNAVDPIPVTMGNEHLLSITIEFGDMKFTYSVKEDKFDESCFNGENNKLTITNNSTCTVMSMTYLNIDTEAYPCLKEPDFGVAFTNKNGTQDGATHIGGILSYTGDTSVVHYLTVGNENPSDMHNYNFNNANIGEITIELEPFLGIIPTEKGYYVKVTYINDFNSFLSVLTRNGYSNKEALYINCLVFLGNTPYYFGPFETDAKAYSVKTQLDSSSTCSIIQIS